MAGNAEATHQICTPCLCIPSLPPLHPTSLSLFAPSPHLLASSLRSEGRGVEGGGWAGGRIIERLIAGRKLLIHFLQYTLCCWRGSFPQSIHLCRTSKFASVQELANCGRLRNTMANDRHMILLSCPVTTRTHLSPVNPNHTANIKSRCSLSQSIATTPTPPPPHHCLFLSDTVPSGLVIHRIHNCNLAFPLLRQGRAGLEGVRHRRSWTMLMIISMQT